MTKGAKQAEKHAFQPVLIMSISASWRAKRALLPQQARSEPFCHFTQFCGLGKENYLCPAKNLTIRNAHYRSQRI